MKKESYRDMRNREHVEMLRRRASDRQKNPPRQASPIHDAIVSKKGKVGHSHMGNAVYEMINKRK